LALGFSGILFRGIFLRDLKGLSDQHLQSLKRLFLCDTFWGIAALLWLATGLMRVFGGFDKGTTKLHIVAIIPFVASMMARGIGF
jgi:putative membrane protein